MSFEGQDPQERWRRIVEGYRALREEELLTRAEWLWREPLPSVVECWDVIRQTESGG